MKRTRVYANIVMTLVIVWLLIPLIATIIYSLFETWTGIVPQGFTLDAYKSIFTNSAFLTSPSWWCCWHCSRSRSIFPGLKSTSRSCA